MNKTHATNNKPGPAKVPPSRKPVSDTPQESGNQPVGRVSAYPVKGSVWMSYSQDGSPYYSVSFQRSYKNSDGEWQYSDNFFPSDLLLLAEAARMAYHLCEELRQQERTSNGKEH